MRLERGGLAILLLLVLLVSAARFRTVWNRGLVNYDEAYFLIETRGILYSLRHLPTLYSDTTRLADFKRELVAQGGIFPPGVAKPTFSFVLALFSLVPWSLRETGNLLSFMAALLSGIILFGCAWRITGDRIVSVLCASLFWLSPIYGYYAVGGYAHILASFFFLCAIWAYLTDRLGLASFCLGLTLTAHYGTIPQVGLFGLAIAGQAISRGPSVRSRIRRLAILAFSAAGPMLFWEALYRTGRYLLSGHLHDVPYRTYWEQIMRQTGWSSDPTPILGVLERNFKVFSGYLHTQGWLSSLLIVMGLGVAVHYHRRLSSKALTLLGISLVTTIFWLFNTRLMVARIIVLFLPLLFLDLAIGLNKWRERFPTAARGFTLWGIGVAAISTVHAISIDSRLRSPYALAARELISRGYQGPVVDPDHWPMWQLYLDRRMPFRPETCGTYAKLRNQCMRFLRDPEHPIVALPFCFRGHIVIKEDPSDARLSDFYERLFSRPPDQVWDMPYSTTRLYKTEDMVTGEGFTHDPSEKLHLYWVTEKDFQGL